MDPAFFIFSGGCRARAYMPVSLAVFLLVVVVVRKYKEFWSG